MEFLDLTTLITIAAAAFVILKLRSILGTRTGYEEPEEHIREAKNRKKAEQDDGTADNVVKLPTRNRQSDEDYVDPALAEIEKYAGKNDTLKNGLIAVHSADNSFTPKQFLGGADMAYEMIVNAFADGDTNSLKNLLSAEVYEGFASAIEERNERGEVTKSSFVGIDSSEIKLAEVRDGDAEVTVRFESQIVSATYDSDGKLIDGDEQEVARVNDIWTFARNTRSRDPNWKLVATEAEG